MFAFIMDFAGWNCRDGTKRTVFCVSSRKKTGVLSGWSREQGVMGEPGGSTNIKSPISNDYNRIIMKKDILNSPAHRTGLCFVSALTIAALVFLLLVTGCTTSKPAPEPVTSIPVTTIPTTITTLPPVPTTTQGWDDATKDKAFTDAADACYNSTPVITNLTTHLVFATCMKNTPLPSGNCAINYRYYVLKYTNEDTTTAGFARQTKNAELAREAYLRGEGYDGINQEYVPCGNATLIKTSFYK
jgi:hypothetical protein